jgi:hypothetical protein
MKRYDPKYPYHMEESEDGDWIRYFDFREEMNAAIRVIKKVRQITHFGSPVDDDIVTDEEWYLRRLKNASKELTDFLIAYPERK